MLSGLPLKTGVGEESGHFRLVPQTDSCTAAKTCAVAMAYSREAAMPGSAAPVRPVMLLPQLVHDVVLARVLNHL